MTRHAPFGRRLGVASLGTFVVLSSLALAGQAHAAPGLRSPAPDQQPQGLSADTSGVAQAVTAAYTAPDAETVVVADCNGGAVDAIAADGTLRTLASGYMCPAGVAVDADGTVYFATYSGDQTAYKIATDGTVTPIGSGLNLALGVDVDDDGNVFVADSGNARVVEIAPDGTQTTLAFTGLQRPYGVSVDSAGDVYTTEPDLGTVIELAADGTQTQVGSGFGYPSGVSASDDGSVLVASNFNDNVVEIAPDGTQSTLPFTGLSEPADVAEDSAGNVYTVNYGGTGVFALAPDDTQRTVSNDIGGYGIAVMRDSRTRQPVVFTSDAPSQAVPGDTYTVTATGGGSENPIMFSAEKSSTRTCVVTDNGDGTADVDLNRVGDCVIDADQAGDDVYRPGHARQTVTVRHRQAIAFDTTPQRPQVGDTYQVQATGGDSGNAVVFSLGQGSDTGCSVTPDGLVTFVHATSCVVAADQAGDEGYVPAATAYQEIAIARGEQVVTFTSLPPAKAKVGRTYEPSATGGATAHRVRFSASGACTARNGVVTFVHAGHCYVYANQSGNADYRPGKAYQAMTVVKP